MRKDFGIGFSATDEECDWAMKRAEFITELSLAHDTSRYGPSLWNNYHGYKCEAVVRRFVGQGLQAWDYRTPILERAYDLVIGEGIKVEVKSYIHEVHERFQVIDNHWPLRADILVGCHAGRGRDSRSVEIRGWVARDVVTAKCFPWAPPANRTDGKQFKRERWFESALFKSAWDLPCGLAYPRAEHWPAPLAKT